MKLLLVHSRRERRSRRTVTGCGPRVFARSSSGCRMCIPLNSARKLDGSRCWWPRVSRRRTTRILSIPSPNSPIGTTASEAWRSLDYCRRERLCGEASSGRNSAGRPFRCHQLHPTCPFTTDASEAELFGPKIGPDVLNGLRQDSRLMVDKITTTPRHLP
jgi:hypothetical protein